MPLVKIPKKATSFEVNSLLKEKKITSLQKDYRRANFPSDKFARRSLKRLLALKEKHKQENIQILNNSIAFIQWQYRRAQILDQSMTQDHNCPNCGQIMNFKDHKLIYVAKLGWTHQKCAEKQNIPPKPKSENYRNKKYFMRSLKKSLREQLPLWDPPKERIWNFNSLNKINYNSHKKLKDEVASLPLHSVVGRINTEIGWEVISPPAYRELTKHGVVSLYLLRSLPEEKWNLLPFSDYKKSLIQNAIGKEPLPALELMQNYRFDRPDPRIADISITCDALDDEDISKGLKLPPLLRREMDREAVYSAVSRYDEKVSYFPRPHAKAIIDDEEMKRKENILEQFPVNADTDEEIDRRQIGKEDNWAKWEELKNAAEEEREPNIPEDERKELVHKFFGWDRAENAKKQFEEKFGHLVNKPLVDDILTGITEENADFDKKKLAEKLKDEEFTSKIIKKDEKAEFGDETDLEDSSEFRNLGKRSESNGNELSDDINLDDSDLIDFSPDVNDVPSKAKIKGFENSEFDSVDVQEEFTTFTDSDELSESHGISGSQDIDDMDNLQQEMAEETEEYDAENVVEGEEIKETTEEEKSITEETAEEDISITEITQKDFSGEKNVGRLMDQMDRETKLSDYSEETMVDGEGDVSYEMSEIDEMKIVAAHEKEDERKLRRWARRNKAKGEKSKEDEEKQKQFLKDIPRLQKAMKGKMDLEEKRIDFPLDEENLLRGKMMDAKNKKAVRNLDGVADMHEILQALKFDRFDMMEKMEEMQRKHNIMKDSVEYEKFAEKTFIDKADDEPWRLDDKRIGRSRELECAADPGSPVIWNVKSDGTSEEDYLEDTQ